MPTATSTVNDRIKELKGVIATKLDENDTIVSSVKKGDDGIDVVITEDQRKTFRANLDVAEEMRKELDLLETQAGLKDWVGRPDHQPIAPQVDATQGGPARPKSLGQLFVESDEFKELQGGRAALTMRRPFEVEMGDIGKLWIPPGAVKDIYRDMATGTPGTFGGTQRDALVEMPRRQNRVRDLFATNPTTASVIEYFRVTGFTNAASVVPERTSGAFTLKPQSALTFAGHQTTVRTIAHWEAAHRNVLADEPQLASLINTELLYGLRLHEDYQILQGTGTGEDLPGLLNDGDILTHTQSSVAGDNKADALRRAMTKIMLAYYEPTGIVVHDNDWEDIELTKSAGSEKLYLFAASIQDGGAPRTWRLPLVATPAIPDGTGLVGAFGLGAQLYDREQATIRIAEQHADFFIRNAVVVLAEERLALAIKRPESFCKITFT